MSGSDRLPSGLEHAVLARCGHGDAPAILIGEGISTRAWGWGRPGDGWVLRVSRGHPEPWRWRGGRAFEPALARELRRLGVPAAEEMTVIAERDGLPSAILERWLPGLVLPASTVRSDPRALAAIGVLLERLRSAPAHTVTGAERTSVLDELWGALESAPLEATIRQAAAAVLQRLEERRHRHVLCHRDLRLAHLLFDDDHALIGLLDLGDAGRDDPAYDLVLLVDELGLEATESVVASLRSADEGLLKAALSLRALRPLLELAPGGDAWGDPSTAGGRLAAALR